jgi:MFS family permease
MRVSWQIVGVIFAGICGLFLGNDSPLWIFQIMLAAVTVGLVLRVMFYRRIPEIEPPVKRKESFMTALGAVVRTPNYASFCAYIFLLMTFTSGVIALFAMVEKNIMGLGDGQVVLLANLGMIGATAGFYLGGKAVDRHGTKTVFLICHFAFGLITALFLFRGLAPQGETFLMIILGTLHFMFGSVGASSSIAISTEMLALLPEENKSLAASMCSMLQSGGRALSGILAAWIIQTGMLKDEWSLWGQDLCKYDSVLVIYAGMIVLLVVALGLVPSVLRKAEWRPIN